MYVHRRSTLAGEAGVKRKFDQRKRRSTFGRMHRAATFLRTDTTNMIFGQSEEIPYPSGMLIAFFSLIHRNCRVGIDWKKTN